jgi:hypothetical protein
MRVSGTRAAASPVSSTDGKNTTVSAGDVQCAPEAGAPVP